MKKPVGYGVLVAVAGLLLDPFMTAEDWHFVVLFFFWILIAVGTAVGTITLLLEKK
jgi:hypothetical protein